MSHINDVLNSKNSAENLAKKEMDKLRQKAIHTGCRECTFFIFKKHAISSGLYSYDNEEARQNSINDTQKGCEEYTLEKCLKVINDAFENNGNFRECTMIELKKEIIKSVAYLITEKAQFDGIRNWDKNKEHTDEQITKCMGLVTKELNISFLAATGSMSIIDYLAKENGGIII
jgi:hypothetical protein